MKLNSSAELMVSVSPLFFRLWFQCLLFRLLLPMDMNRTVSLVIRLECITNPLLPLLHTWLIDLDEHPHSYLAHWMTCVNSQSRGENLPISTHLYRWTKRRAISSSSISWRRISVKSPDMTRSPSNPTGEVVCQVCLYLVVFCQNVCYPLMNF